MIARVIQTVFLTTIVCLTLSAQPWMRSPYLKVQRSEASVYDIQQAFRSWWGNKPYEKGRGYKQYHRWEYMAVRLGYPDGHLPSARTYFEAAEAAAAEGRSQEENLATANWIPLGISSWQNGVSGYNPGNGRINFIAQHPTNAQIIYVASSSGGIWKTTDGGQTWSTTYDALTRLGTSCIAIHPQNPSLVFVGTGDKDGWDTEAFGIMKTTDAGNTWVNGGLNSGTGYNNINKILINPQNPQSMMVATPYNIYKSLNGGSTWSNVYTGSDIRDMEYKPGDTSVIYCGGERFLKSVDGGLSFTANLSLPHDTTRLEVAVSEADASVVYLLASNGNNSFGGLYRSANQGNSFTLMSDSPNLLGYAEDGSDDAGQAWYDLALAVSPQDENMVFIGGVNVWKSTNGGASWNILTHWVYGGPYQYSHADIHYLGFYGNNLYCGSDGGAFISLDFGATWNDISSGLAITQFYAFSNSPIDNDLIVGGAQDNGSNVFNNGTWTHVFGADGFEAITHPTDVNTFYASYQSGGILRTRDGGDNFDYINTTGQEGSWLTPIAMDPQNPSTIFMALEDLFVSFDEGDNWNNLTNGITLSEKIDVLTIAPGGSSDLYFSEQSTFYYSHNGGTTWTATNPIGSFYISDIAVDAVDPLKVWITGNSSSGDRVFYSTNGGVSWTNITGALSGTGINCIMNDPASPRGLYVGTNTGVFYRDSTMSAWVSYDNGLPEVIVNELELSAGGKLRAATYGRGIWESDVYDYTHVQTSEVRIDIFPNPASDFLVVNAIEGMMPQHLAIFDASAKLVKIIPVTGNTVNVSLEGIPDGQYYLRIEHENDVLEVKKFNIFHN